MDQTASQAHIQDNTEKTVKSISGAGNSIRNESSFNIGSQKMLDETDKYVYSSKN